MLRRPKPNAPSEKGKKAVDPEGGNKLCRRQHQRQRIEKKLIGLDDPAPNGSAVPSGHLT
jgi:hypothetical protein